MFSSAPELLSARDFLAASADDLRITPHAAWPLFIRGLQAQYRQSYLRGLWVVLPGFAVAAVWVYLEHAGLLVRNHTKIPYTVYVLGGTVLWQLFADALNAPLQKLTTSRMSLTKSRLPHETYVVSGILEASFNFVVRLVPFLIVLVASGTALRWTLVLVPLGGICLLLLGVAIGMALAPAGLLYQDVGKVLLFVAQFWFFLTPVVYAPPAHGVATLLIRLNPVTPLLVTTRDWAVGRSVGLSAAMGEVVIGSAILLVLAWLMYRLARPHVVARL